jgi:phage head maturation protease
MSLQYRIAPEGQVRDIDDGKREVLVEIPWEVIDSYNTDFERSAFDEFFAQRLPVMCWQHQRTEPIGRVKDRQATRSAHQFRAGFSDFDAVPRARQAFAQIRDKEIVDFSFGFDQAQSMPHPSVRGAVRFTRARMPEISPVTIGAIPGAVAVGIRAEAEIANVRGLLEAGAIDEDGANEMLRAAGLEPLPRQRVEVQDPKELLTEAVRAVLAETGERALTITIGDDGAVSTTGDPASVGTVDLNDDGDGDYDRDATISAIDGAIDAALDYFGQVDLSTLPAEVGMAYQLIQAADVACDELMEGEGIPDYDADGDGSGSDGDAPVGQRDDETPEDGERAASEYADPGYQDDKQKRYPIDTAEHVRAAWSYINQADNAAKYSAEDLAKVKDRIKAAAKKFGVEISSDGGKRSADDVGDVEILMARTKLGRR